VNVARIKSCRGISYRAALITALFALLICLSLYVNTSSYGWDDFGSEIREQGDHALLSVSQWRDISTGELPAITGVIRNDFLVNDDTTGTSSRGSPSVAADGAGNSVIVWYDARNGNLDSDIYSQRYDSSGVPAGPNHRVNDDAGYCMQHNPSVAMNETGNFVVVWSDERNAASDIYFQRYDSSGTVQGPNLKVSYDLSLESNWDPSVAIDGTGNFAVVWIGWRDGETYVCSQRFDSFGTRLGPNFKVNDDPSSNGHWSPSITMDRSGNFAVVWSDDRTGDSDIYFQQYDSFGMRQGPNVKVNDDLGSGSQSSPSLTMHSSGDFVVAWEDGRSGGSGIYLQRFDAAGIPQDSNFKVNELSPGYHPSVGVDGSRNLVVAWKGTCDALDAVCSQRYDSSGTRIGTNFRVNDDTISAGHFGASVAVDVSGNFTVVWTGWSKDESGICSQRYDSSGTPQGSNFRVNDDENASYQAYPSVAVDRSGNLVFAWEDGRRRYPLAVYLQRYESSGIPLGSNFRAYGHARNSPQRWPSVAMERCGNFGVAWAEARNNDFNIYLQRYDSVGTPLGSHLRVNDRAQGGQYRPAVATGMSGRFVVAWDDTRNGDRDVYAQCYDASGAAIGPNFRVNEDAGSMIQDFPSVAMDGRGNFVVAWVDERNGYLDFDIYAQRHDASGTPLDTNLRVNDDPGSRIQVRPSVSMDQCGNSVIAWQDARNGYYDIYMQCYDSSGTPQGPNLRVNDDHEGARHHWDASVAMDPQGGRFVVVWTDFRNPDGDAELVAQKFQNGAPFGPNVQINQPDLFPSNHQQAWRFSVTCNQEVIAFAWMDNRRHKGWDVYGKLTDWELLGIRETPRLHSSNLTLHAYPNPFSTSIAIHGASGGVRVYDICGRLIARIEEGVWNGRDLDGSEVKSGIYFLKAQGYEPAKVVKLR